jgi:hypothetical protein
MVFLYLPLKRVNEIPSSSSAKAIALDAPPVPVLMPFDDVV